jgi:putative nucleotidyltransferase with HDIG domain
MNSSSLKGAWATFRFYALAIGLLGTLMSAYMATLEARPHPWNPYLLYALAGGATYAVISAFVLSSLTRPTVMNALAVIDVFVLSLIATIDGHPMSTAVLATYAAISVGSLATNMMVGMASAGLAAMLYAIMLIMGDMSAPLKTLAPGIFPLTLFFVFGAAGATMRRQIFGGVNTEVVETRDKAIEEAQKKARNLFLEKEERERQLFDKQRKLYALMSISHLMSSTRNSKELLQVMCTKAREEMNCASAFVMVLEQGELRLVQSIGISELTKRLMDCKLGEGVLGEVAASNRSARLSEKDADPRLKAFKKNWESFRNILVVPLSTSQDPLPFGVLGVANLLVGDEFQEEHEDYLKILATSAGIALKNISLTEDLEQSYNEIIHALAQAIEAKDPYTHGHISRVKDFASSLARALKIPDNEVKIIAKGAILHDVGKISTPNEILNKPGALTPAERKKMDDHVTSSIHILKDIKSLPPEVFEMVLYHHERFDGKGYPYGLKADEIPLGAQIISVVDAYDAMTSDRPYRKGFPQEKALELLANCAGSQFNPKVLQAFFTLFNYKPKSALAGDGKPQLELSK